MIRRAAVLLAVFLWLGAMFALGLNAQERRATWVVNAVDASQIDSLRAAVAVLGGSSDHPDVVFYRIRGPYKGLRDSLFVYADSNREAPVGRRTAVTGPWKRWVQFVELDGLIEVPRDSTPEGAAPLEAVFWFKDLHGAGLACAMGACGKNVKVGAADTGMDRDHPEFAGRLLYGKGYGGTTIIGGVIDSTDFADNIPGCNGHGTHVESTLGGATMGGAKDATLVFYRVMNTGDGGCLAASSNTTKALLDATRNGVDVMNVSIGHSQSYSMGLALLARKAAGLVTCGASGNDGTGPTIYWPGGDSSAVGAGAVDAAGARAYFSRWGPALDFVGAGVGVLGASPGGGYVTKSGTSMGSPWTCTTIAQLLSTPEFQAMPKNKARVDSAQALLCASAKFKPVGGRDDYMGCGVPDASRAIALMRGGGEVAAPKTDTLTTAAAVTVCKPFVTTWPAWRAVTSTPWITLTSTQDSLCYTTIPALMPPGGGTATIQILRQ